VLCAERKPNTTSMSGKNISFPTSNIIFSFTVGPDSEKIELIRSFIRGARRKTYLFHMLILASVVALVLVTSYIIGQLESPLLGFLAMITASYIFLMIISLFLFRRPRAFPIRHKILIHSPPKGFPSLVIFTDYFPRGRSFLAVPLETIGRIGIIKRPLFPWFKKLELEILEILIMDHKDRIIARLGGLCREEELREAAVSLWKKILEIQKESSAANHDSYIPETTG